MLEEYCMLTCKELRGKRSASKRSGDNTDTYDGEKKVSIEEKRIVAVDTMTSQTVPAKVVTELIAASNTGTSLVYALVGTVTSPGPDPGVTSIPNLPSYELLLKQLQDAKAALGAAQGSGGVKTKVKVTTTEFETSSSENERVKKHKSPSKHGSYFNDLLKKVSDEREALILKREEKEAKVKNLSQKPKNEKKPGTDVGADKARDKSTAEEAKRDKNRKKNENTCCQEKEECTCG